MTVDFKYGSMIEVPRAALTADELATVAEFYSFGTNDLTQTTFGMSRDDAESKFLIEYTEKGMLPTNPFQQLDRGGVGKLIKMTVELGRQTRPDMHMGICGEHGGDPNSIEFCHMAGLNYVSCSPYPRADRPAGSSAGRHQAPVSGWLFFGFLLAEGHALRRALSALVGGRWPDAWSSQGQVVWV